MRMILGQGKPKVEGGPPKDPDALAVYPLGLPLLLNPVGIVALIAYSGSPDLVDIGIVAVAGLIVLGIDIAVLLGLSRVGAPERAGRLGHGDRARLPAGRARHPAHRRRRRRHGRHAASVSTTT